MTLYNLGRDSTAQNLSLILELLVADTEELYITLFMSSPLTLA